MRDSAAGAERKGKLEVGPIRRPLRFTRYQGSALNCALSLTLRNAPQGFHQQQQSLSPENPESQNLTH